MSFIRAGACTRVARQARTRPGMTEMQERIDAAVVEWAKRIPVDQIPTVLAFLTARLLSEGHAARESEHNGTSARDAEKLLTADEPAARLSLPESWVRTEERARRIPGVRAGRYVRFKLSDVRAGPRRAAQSCSTAPSQPERRA